MIHVLLKHNTALMLNIKFEDWATSFGVILVGIFEPPHDKPNKMTLRPAKTQISLGIRPV